MVVMPPPQYEGPGGDARARGGPGDGPPSLRAPAAAAAQSQGVRALQEWSVTLLQLTLYHKLRWKIEDLSLSAMLTISHDRHCGHVYRIFKSHSNYFLIHVRFFLMMMTHLLFSNTTT